MSNQRPNRGSSAYRPRKRINKLFLSISARKEKTDVGFEIPFFPAIKVGNKSAELENTLSLKKMLKNVSVLEIPDVLLYGIRLYCLNEFHQKCVYADILINQINPGELMKKYFQKKVDIKEVDLKKIVDISAVCLYDFSKINAISTNKKKIFEIPIQGTDTISDKINKISNMKEISCSEFSNMEYIDVTSISKGKGTQGAVKRYGVKLLSHKDSKKRRAIATQGGKTPKHTRPTVGAAGQLGFARRTEHNKILLKKGLKEELTSIFKNYGQIKNPYVIILGSIPGPTKRMVWIRKSQRKKGQISTVLKYVRLI